MAALTKASVTQHQEPTVERTNNQKGLLAPPEPTLSFVT